MNSKELKIVLENHQKWLSGVGGKRANLARATLARANLTGADLARANLYSATLRGANLRYANLTGANLAGADLYGANLTGTCLDPNAAMPKKVELDPGFEVDGEWVYGYRTQRSQHCGSEIYKPGKSYTAPVFSVDVNTDCHPGIYLATKDWLAENYPNQPLVRCRCRRSDVLKAGDKFRAKSIEVLNEEE